MCSGLFFVFYLSDPYSRTPRLQTAALQDAPEILRFPIRTYSSESTFPPQTIIYYMPPLPDSRSTNRHLFLLYLAPLQLIPKSHPTVLSVGKQWSGCLRSQLWTDNSLWQFSWVVTEFRQPDLLLVLDRPSRDCWSSAQECGRCSLDKNFWWTGSKTDWD